MYISLFLSGGMVTALDDVVGNIVSTLKQLGMCNDTLIVFTSEVSHISGNVPVVRSRNLCKLALKNGSSNEFGGNNFPLPGAKATMYEGGTRVPSFIHAPFLEYKGATYSE